jgi:ribosome-binding protein aMBF1 (putative translation factor)
MQPRDSEPRGQGETVSPDFEGVVMAEQETLDDLVERFIEIGAKDPHEGARTLMAPTTELETWQAFGQQVAEARAARGWSVRQLAERVRDLGFDGPSEKRIGHIEAGSRIGAADDVRQRAENVRLREVVALTVALGPALPNLLAPLNTRRCGGVRLGNRVVSPDDYRAWVLGIDREPLGGDGEDLRLYTEFVPQSWAKWVEHKTAEAARPNEPPWLTLARLEQRERREILSAASVAPQFARDDSERANDGR